MAQLDYATEGPMPSEEVPYDREIADRMKHDLERAQQAAEHHRKTQYVAQEKADQAERCIEALRAALRVLEGEPDYDPQAEKLAKMEREMAMKSRIDPSTYRND